MKALISLLAVLLTLSCASLAQTAQVQPPASTQPAVASPSTEAAAVSAAGTVAAAPAAAPFTAGAKIFLEPMDGFEQFVSQAILKKKVPVVLVHERAQADFVMSGQAHVHKRGFFTGFVLDTGGKGSVSIKDARTGNQAFACHFNKVDQMEGEGYIYQTWADACAKHLKKGLEKKEKK